MMYTVEGWTSSSECVAVRTVARAATAVREAERQALDLGASIVWVRDAHGRAAFTFEHGWWRKHFGDDALSLAIGADR